MINFIVFILAFMFMELVAWGSHKYIMHGFLWFLHKSHHTKHNNFFELNDIFVLLFAMPAFLAIYFGFMFDYAILVYFGFGITFYGLVYLIFHDIYVHRRISLLSNLKLPYFEYLRMRHNAHHGKKTKKNTVYFGFLWSGL